MSICRTICESHQKRSGSLFYVEIVLGKTVQDGAALRHLQCDAVGAGRFDHFTDLSDAGLIHNVDGHVLNSDAPDGIVAVRDKEPDDKGDHQCDQLEYERVRQRFPDFSDHDPDLPFHNRNLRLAVVLF